MNDHMKQVPLRGNFFTEEEWDELILNFKPGDYLIQRKPGRLAVGRLSGRLINRTRITKTTTNKKKNKRRRGRR